MVVSEIQTDRLSCFCRAARSEAEQLKGRVREAEARIGDLQSENAALRGRLGLPPHNSAPAAGTAIPALPWKEEQGSAHAVEVPADSSEETHAAVQQPEQREGDSSRVIVQEAEDQVDVPSATSAGRQPAEEIQ